MGLPMPRLWLIPTPSPNAFATGRNPRHASVAFTEGVLDLMNDRELEGVVAHELGHVLHRDILISSVAATLAAALTQLAYMAMWFGGGRRDEEEEGGGLTALLMVILAPLAAGLIQMSISRTRELSADATSVKYTGSPDGLDQRFTQARTRLGAGSVECDARHGASVHHETVHQRVVEFVVLDPSFDGRADCPAGGFAVRALGGRLPAFGLP